MKLNEIKTRIINFILNMATSGKYEETSEFSQTDDFIQYVLQNCIWFFGAVLCVIFAVANIQLQVYDDALICVITALVFLACFLMGRTNISRIVPIWTSVIGFGLNWIFLVSFGNAHGENFLFMYMFPACAITGVGMRNGAIASTVFGLIIYLEMIIPGLSNHIYPPVVSTRILISYFLVVFITTVIEATRRAKDRHIEEQNIRLQELREEADAANRIKSNFLARMSHEIRTPMNAISGMTELLMRKNLPEEAKEDVKDIKHAASQLLFLINDILDFSKIEAGKLEIIPVSYMLSSLVNDVVNIIRMRIKERPVRFYTNIDGNIPKNLIGDEVRLRQIILNLLSNAVKYTQKGSIGMTITMAIKTDKQVWLKIAVSDTGQGVKPEDQERLFNDFVQVDTIKNKGIEGTGLGLAITKRLCDAMDGDISLASVYGSGSTFTVIIPQGIGSGAPIAAVEEPERKRALIYERRLVYAESVCWSLEKMGVPYVMVNDLDAFAEALGREEWYFVFSGYNLYDKIKPIMENTAYPSGRKPPLALMVEWETEAYIPNVRFVPLPVKSFSIANTLNGEADRRDYFYSSSNINRIRFTISGARLLIVDDIAVNLKVAEGLLAPYRAIVDTCLGGREAIEMVKRRNYDIVFMDHMMPEMNGIEATAAIRAWEKERMYSTGSLGKQIPIIALTANVVSGMREVFIENGFSDFLAKPIDISELDYILDRWISKDKKELGAQMDAKAEPPIITLNFSQIPGIDTVMGIAMAGGTEEAYIDVLSLFCKDVEERLPMLQTIPDDLSSIAIHTHSLKNTSAIIGAEKIAEMAVELEADSNAENYVSVRKKLPIFATSLAELSNSICLALKQNETESDQSFDDLPSNFYTLLRELATALESQKIADLSSILKELKDLSRQQLIDTKTTKALEQVADQILIAEYDKALKTVEELATINS